MNDNKESKKVILDVFNPTTQEVAPHELTIDKNNDYLLRQVDQNDDDEWQVVEGGHFLKFPGRFSKDQVLEGIEEYKKVNEGQVNVEALEKENTAKLEAFDKPTENATPAPEAVEPVEPSTEHVDSGIPAPMPSAPGNEGVNDTQSVVGPV